MLERKWLAVTATPLIANGTTIGIVTVQDTAGFRTKQSVFLLSSTLGQKQYQVQEVLSPTQLVLGPMGSKVGRQNFADVSAFLIGDNAAIGAPEQDRTANPPDKDHYSAIYESDPVVADRVILVDQFGRLFGNGNPLPISFDGTVSIGDVEIKDGGNVLKVNPDGSINVNITPSVGGTNVVKNKFNSINAVMANMATTLVTYTVPTGKTSIVQRAAVSGENIAKYTLLINGNPQATLRTYFGGELNGYFEFTTGQDNGLVVTAGDVISIEVIHGRPQLANFEGRIQIYEVAL